ncbi:MAG: hypothetical protein J5965_04550 [Aeriscardovia sp.]|nr:hypothetical protein [Aeriscardovia sp.]
MNLKKVRFKDGCVFVPRDFIELVFVQPKRGEIPIIMVVKNEELYNTPRFYFFANTYPRNFTQQEKEYLLDQAELYYPGYRSLDDKTITVTPRKRSDGTVQYEYFDKDGNPRTYEDWESAPVIGIFQMEQRSSITSPPLPYGIEIKYKWRRDPRKNLKLLDR